MNASLFQDYVRSLFSKVVTNFTEKYNDRSRESDLLHKQMLREEYSTTLTWDSNTLNHSIVAADVVALDSPLPLKSRSTLKRASGEIPKIGMKLSKGEKLLNDVRRMEADGKTQAEISAKLFDDVPTVIKGIDIRNEIIFRRALSTGAALVTDEENTGTAIRASFGLLPENTFPCLADVWTGSDPTPQDDVRQLFDKAEEDGNVIHAVLLSRPAFDAWRRSRQGKELAATFNGQTFTAQTKLPVPGRKSFLDALADEFGAEFRIVSGSFKVEGVDGKKKKVEAWKTANVVAIPDNIVGRLVYGSTVEETFPVAGVTYQKSGSYILVSKYSMNEPSLREFTSSQAYCIPVIDNGDSIYILESDKKGKPEAPPEPETPGQGGDGGEGN